MKRKTLVKIHIAATMIAALTIATFFISSLIAEIQGDEILIKAVKTGIFYSLPILFLAMPTLAISGNKLANHSRHPDVLQKQRRMKFIIINGMLLITLAVFLYYRANYHAIDNSFLIAQLAEFAFGFSNLVLISMNIKTGLKLSGRFNKRVMG